MQQGKHAQARRGVSTHRRYLRMLGLLYSVTASHHRQLSCTRRSRLACAGDKDAAARTRAERWREDAAFAPSFAVPLPLPASTSRAFAAAAACLLLMQVSALASNASSPGRRQRPQQQVAKQQQQHTGTGHDNLGGQALHVWV